MEIHCQVSSNITPALYTLNLDWIFMKNYSYNNLLNPLKAFLVYSQKSIKEAQRPHDAKHYCQAQFHLVKLKRDSSIITV